MGAQPGHKGSFRAMLPSDQVDQQVLCRPEPQCALCKSEVVVDEDKAIRHQVFDLPRIDPVVTEYVRVRGICCGCGPHTGCRARSTPGMWAALCRRHQAGECIKALAAGEGVSVSSIRRWQKKLKLRLKDDPGSVPPRKGPVPVVVKAKSWASRPATTKTSKTEFFAARGKKASRDAFGPLHHSMALLKAASRSHHPGRPDEMARGLSSAGRALQWHCRGQRFDPA